MMKLKKTLCIVLALVMALGLLSACGGGGTTNTPTPEYAYVANYTELSRDLSGVSNSVLSDGRIYFLTSVKGEPIVEQIPTYDDNGNPILDEEGNPVMQEYTYDSWVPAIYSIALDGTDLKPFEGYSAIETPENAEYGGSWVTGMCALPGGGFALVENVSYSIASGGDAAAEGDGSESSGEGETAAAADALAAVDVPAIEPMPGGNVEYTYVETYYLRTFDASGAEGEKIDLSAMFAEENEYFYVSNFTVDGDGNIYMMVNGAIMVIGADGSKLGEIDLSNESTGVSNIVTAADGSVCALSYNSEYTALSLRPVNVSTLRLDEPIAELPSEAYGARVAGGSYDFCYNKGESFYGYTLATDTEEQLVTWINSDVDSNNISSACLTENGDIVCLSSEYSSSGDGTITYFITLKKTPYDQVPQKTTLTLACVYLDYRVKSQILDFNRKSSDYRIEVRDYSEFNTDDDYSAGLTKLITEIGSGAVPDILVTSSLPMDVFGNKGLFEDLWPYIEADEELGGRAGVVEPFFNAISEDGKLYQITSSFTVRTLAGPASIIGSEPGWDYDDIYAALEKMPEGCEVFSVGTTRDSVFSDVCSLNLSNFVDWSTGQCSFNSEEFIDLLEFANGFPQTFDWEHYEWTAESDDVYRVQAGKQLLISMYLSSLYNYSYYCSAFGDDMVLKGYPGVEGSGAVFSMNTGLAISSACKDKDAAWSFIRYCLDEDYQKENSYSGMCTNKAAYEAQFEAQIGQESYYYDNEGNETKRTFTQEDADAIKAVVDNTVIAVGYSSDQITSIINEEAAYYFNGEKSAQDVAATIQNRVSIYVSEQS